MVSPVVLEEIPAGVGQEVCHFGFSGFPPDLGAHRQAAGLGAAIERIGYISGIGGLISLLLGYHLLPFGIDTFFFGQFCGSMGLLLRLMGGPAFHLGPFCVAGRQDGLLFGPVSLLVGDGFLLIGYILHLLAYALDDSGILFGLLQAVHLFLHGRHFLTGLSATQLIRDHRHTSQEHESYQAIQYGWTDFHFLRITNWVISSLWEAPLMNSLTLALTVSTMCLLSAPLHSARAASRRDSPNWS